MSFQPDPRLLPLAGLGLLALVQSRRGSLARMAPVFSRQLWSDWSKGVRELSSWKTDMPVTSVSVSSGRNPRVAVVSEHEARVYDLTSGASRLRNGLGGGSARSGDISPDGKMLAISGMGKHLMVIDVDQRVLFASHEQSGRVMSARFSADGGSLAFVTDDKEVTLARFPSLDMQGEWSVDQSLVSVDVSADGRYIVACGASRVYVFDRKQPRNSFDYGRRDAYNSVSMSADGSKICATSFDFVDVVNAETGGSLASVPSNTNMFGGAISPDGSYFCTIGDGNLAYLQPVDIMRPSFEIPTGSTSYATAFSRDGRYLAIVSHHDGYVTVYEPKP